MYVNQKFAQGVLEAFFAGENRLTEGHAKQWETSCGLWPERRQAQCPPPPPTPDCGLLIAKAQTTSVAKSAVSSRKISMKERI